MNIDFIAIQKRYLQSKKEIFSRINKISSKADYINGEYVSLFEKEMSKFMKCKYVIGVNSGFDALFLSLIAMGIGKGDEVITVSNSYIATANSIILAGAKPIFIDVKDDYNMNEELIERAISKRTRAIMPVHLTGNPCKIDRIYRIAKKHKLEIIEDAAQAIGAKYKNKMIGTWGKVGCFSMHPIKNLGVMGDGGFIVTNSKRLNNKLRLIKNHGHKNRDEIIDIGFNSRLDSFQAAIGHIFLKKMNKWNLRLQIIASKYRNNIKEPVIHPIIEKEAYAVYQNYIIRVSNRAKLQKYLARKKIETKIHYPIPIHMQKAYKDIGFNKTDLKKTEEQSKNILSLPIYPELSDKMVDYVIKEVNSFYGNQ